MLLWMAPACSGTVGPMDAGWDAGADGDAGHDGDAGDDPGSDGDAGADLPDGDPGWVDPPTTTLAPPGTDAVFSNPERGFYRTLSLVEEG